MSWDAKRLSEQIKYNAQRAEAGLHDTPSRIKRVPSREEFYWLEYDRYLAEFVVYNYLWERSFLETRELFYCGTKAKDF